ncbi:MAG: hypothetical protein AAGH43_04620 [Pseudomonadota bacterium]
MAGLLALVAGMILLPLPLPFGIPLLAVGVILLLSSSITARRIVRALRAKSDMLDRLFTAVEERLAGRAGALLRSTRRIRSRRRRGHDAHRTPAE